jgi:A1 cistron-splicing factor AAR2
MSSPSGGPLPGAVMPQLDPDTALRLAQTGGTLVCLGVPEGCEFGVDYMGWTTGPKFRGVKMIPPGQHIVYYSSGQGGVRSSIVLSFAPGAVVVTAWDAGCEMLTPPPLVDESTAAAVTAAVRRMEFDQFLGAYPLQHAARWRDATRYVTAAVVARVQPVGGTLRPLPQPLPASLAAPAAPAAGAPSSGDTNHATNRAAASDHVTDVAASTGTERAAGSSAGVAAGTSGTLQPGGTTCEQSASGTGAHLFFTRMPGVGAGAKPADVTRHAMDTTCGLAALLARPAGAAAAADGPPQARLGGGPSGTLTPAALQLLGELQLSFVLFIMGQSLEALEQWKRLVDALCRCEDALCRAGGEARGAAAAADGRAPDPTAAATAASVPEALLAEAFAVIGSQLGDVPADFFTDALSEKNFMVHSLTALARVLRTRAQEVSPPVRAAAVRLLRQVEQRFTWQVPGADAARAACAAAQAADGGSGSCGLGDSTGESEGGQGRGKHADMASLLAALAEDADGGDLPVIVTEDEA